MVFSTLITVGVGSLLIVADGISSLMLMILIGGVLSEGVLEEDANWKDKALAVLAGVGWWGICSTPWVLTYYFFR